MPIRDTRYYGWKTIIKDVQQEVYEYDYWWPRYRKYKASCVDSSGTLYVAGIYESNNGTSSEYNIFVAKIIENDGEYFVRDLYREPSVGNGTDIYDMTVDRDDNIYFVGADEYDNTNKYNSFVYRSTSALSRSFERVDTVLRTDFDDYNIYNTGVAVNSSGSVFVCGYADNSQKWIVRSSSDGSSGSFGFLENFSTSSWSVAVVNDIAIDDFDNIYVVGGADTGTNYSWIVRKSTTGLSGSFQNVENFERYGLTSVAHTVACFSSSVYVAGTEQTFASVRRVLIRSSSFRGGGEADTFGDVYSWPITTVVPDVYDSAVDSKGHVYVTCASGSGARWVVLGSIAGLSGTFSKVDDAVLSIGSADSDPYSISIDSKDNVFVVGTTTQNRHGCIRVGKYSVNSASLGPAMWSTSVGYVQSEISGTLVEKFRLMNISEFPHSHGLFQMPNMVLGTVNSGKIGNTEDDIIQVNYFGSVVYVMWPKQKDQEIPVKGFGDLAAGQRSGKLKNTFEPGEIIDVEDHDHLTLYCYLLKQASGTLDNVEIKIERRPLKSTGYTFDQSIEYETSGSVTVAKLRDIVYKKEVDYGNLTDKEIGYPIDIPLTNVKELRISARHTNGQTIEDNKNFVVWGRFIRSEEET